MPKNQAETTESQSLLLDNALQKQESSIADDRDALLRLKASLENISIKVDADHDEITEKISTLLSIIINTSKKYKALIGLNSNKLFQNELNKLFNTNKPGVIDTEVKKFEAIQQLNLIFSTYLLYLDAMFILVTFQNKVNNYVKKDKQYDAVIKSIEDLKKDKFIKYCSKNINSILKYLDENTNALKYKEYFKMLNFYLKFIDNVIIPPSDELIKDFQTNHTKKEEGSTLIKDENKKKGKKYFYKDIEGFYLSLSSVIEEYSQCPELTWLRFSDSEINPKMTSIDLLSTIQDALSLVRFLNGFKNSIQTILDRYPLSPSDIRTDELIVSTNIIRIRTAVILSGLLIATYKKYKELLIGLKHIDQFISTQSQFNNETNSKLLLLFKEAIALINLQNNFYFFKKNRAWLCALLDLIDEKGEVFKEISQDGEETKKTAVQLSLKMQGNQSLITINYKQKKTPLNTKKNKGNTGEENYIIPPDLTPEEMATPDAPRTMLTNEFDDKVVQLIDSYTVIINNLIDAIQKQSDNINNALHHGCRYEQIKKISEFSNTVTKMKLALEVAPFPWYVDQLNPAHLSRINLYQLLTKLNLVNAKLNNLNHLLLEKNAELKKYREAQKNSNQQNKSALNSSLEKSLSFDQSDQLKSETTTKNDQINKISFSKLIKEFQSEAEIQQLISLPKGSLEFIYAMKKQSIDRGYIELPKEIKNIFDCLSHFIQSTFPNASATIELVGSSIESTISSHELPHDIDFRITLQDTNIKNDSFYGTVTSSFATYIMSDHSSLKHYLPGSNPHINGLVELNSDTRKVDVQFLSKKYTPIFTIDQITIKEDGEILVSEEEKDENIKNDFARKILRPAAGVDLQHVINNDIRVLFMLLKKHLQGYHYHEEIEKILSSLALKIDSSHIDIIKNKIQHLYDVFGRKFLQELIDTGLGVKIVNALSGSNQSSPIIKVNQLRKALQQCGLLETQFNPNIVKGLTQHGLYKLPVNTSTRTQESAPSFHPNS